jgi:hypothetical protein
VSGTERDPALAVLAELRESTMVEAWGADKTPEDRRRIVAAALVFASQLEQRLDEDSAGLREEEAQRFLMDLINASISEFAAREGIHTGEATTFLSDLGTRDYVLEFNEVLEAHADPSSEETLDGRLERAVQERREKAVWSRHWSTG